MTDPLLDAIGAGVRTYDLSRPYEVGMPQSPNHPAYWHTLPRRHGDMIREDGGSAANDLIVLGTHVGTHMDALAHVSQDGRLHGDVDAAQAQVGGRFDDLGIDQVAAIIGRGVLLDVPRALGLDVLDADHEITPDQLAATVDAQGTPLRPDDVVLVRSGWGRRWGEGQVYLGTTTGAPGPGEEAARWLAAQRPSAVGADTIAFEHLPAGQGHRVLPVHRVLLVEHGINIIETMALEELAADAVHEFAIFVAPLRLVGATGSPVRPIAVTGS